MIFEDEKPLLKIYDCGLKITRGLSSFFMLILNAIFQLIDIIDNIKRIMM